MKKGCLTLKGEMIRQMMLNENSWILRSVIFVKYVGATIRIILIDYYLNLLKCFVFINKNINILLMLTKIILKPVKWKMFFLKPFSYQTYPLIVVLYISFLRHDFLGFLLKLKKRLMNTLWKDPVKSNVIRNCWVFRVMSQGRI